MQETKEMQVRSLGREDPLEEEMATDSSILAWEIPWTEEPGRLQSVELGLQSVGLQRLRHDRVTEHTLSYKADIIDLSADIRFPSAALSPWRCACELPFHPRAESHYNL